MAISAFEGAGVRPRGGAAGHWPNGRHSLDFAGGHGRVEGSVGKFAAGLLCCLGAAAPASLTIAQDDFPIVGTYTENQVCRGDSSDANVPRVKVTEKGIDSAFGFCTILSRKREGNTFAVHVECNGAGGSQMVGDVNFSVRDENTIDFADQDQTYKAVLHRCPG
jgi:hypothetical protein